MPNRDLIASFFDVIKLEKIVLFFVLIGTVTLYVFLIIERIDIRNSCTIIL